MNGLTPAEHVALSRLLTPPEMREPVNVGEPLEAISFDLVEQRRAVYAPYPSDHPRSAFRQGCWEITPAGREALKLWPLMQALMEAA